MYVLPSLESVNLDSSISGLAPALMAAATWARIRAAEAILNEEQAKDKEWDGQQR